MDTNRDLFIDLLKSVNRRGVDNVLPTGIQRQLMLMAKPGWLQLKSR
jgi:hypothetical protein